jgi:hypothetical protein
MFDCLPSNKCETQNIDPRSSQNTNQDKCQKKPLCLDIIFKLQKLKDKEKILKEAIFSSTEE